AIQSSAIKKVLTLDTELSLWNTYEGYHVQAGSTSDWSCLSKPSDAMQPAVQLIVGITKWCALIHCEEATKAILETDRIGLKKYAFDRWVDSTRD
ncbi:hypothetical protein CEXT_788151, partial [Caerostris extrusa]